MKFYIGVTDYNWFTFLSELNPEDVNFWQPGGGSFKIVDNGAPFLFKLKSPYNAIAGVGFYFRHTSLPISIAWESFGERNGCSTFQELENVIRKYREDKTMVNPTVGCIILNAPVFFKREDWIPLPVDWSNNIVRGKSYNTEEIIGGMLWAQVERTLEKYHVKIYPEAENQSQLLEDNSPNYYSSILTKIRIGQGAFRVGVIDAYQRRCSISGEKTLPVLEAAHIKPYSLSGQNAISNGILLRSDLHKLFDQGYLTVTPDFNVEISKRIKEEFENGREYYKHHGNSLLFMPSTEFEKPNLGYLKWHNENVFKG